MFVIRIFKSQIRFFSKQSIAAIVALSVFVSSFFSGQAANAIEPVAALPFEDITLEAEGVTVAIPAESWYFVSSTSHVTGEVSFERPAGFTNCYADVHFYLENPVTGAEVYLDWVYLGLATSSSSLNALLSIWSVSSVEEQQSALLRMDVDRTCYTSNWAPITSSGTVYESINFTSDKPGGRVYEILTKQKKSGKKVKVWLGWYTPYSIAGMLQDYAFQLSSPGSNTVYGNVRVVSGDYFQNKVYLGKLKRKKRYYVRIWTIHPVLGIGYGEPEVLTIKTK